MCSESIVCVCIDVMIVCCVKNEKHIWTPVKPGMNVKYDDGNGWKIKSFKITQNMGFQWELKIWKGDETCCIGKRAYIVKLTWGREGGGVVKCPNIVKNR